MAKKWMLAMLKAVFRLLVDHLQLIRHIVLRDAADSHIDGKGKPPLRLSREQRLLADYAETEQ